jgi:hypothetical protein
MAANGVLLWVVASVPRCDKTMTLGADEFAVGSCFTYFPSGFASFVSRYRAENLALCR